MGLMHHAESAKANGWFEERHMMHHAVLASQVCKIKRTYHSSCLDKGLLQSPHLRVCSEETIVEVVLSWRSACSLSVTET